MNNERKFTYEDVRRILHEAIILAGFEVFKLTENENVLEREAFCKEYADIAFFAMDLSNDKIDSLLIQYNITHN